jgi:hypothetical protein
MVTRYSSIVVFVLLLASCAGTVVRKDDVVNPSTGALSVGSVQTKVSSRAKEQLPENVKFDLTALNSTIERAISASNLRDPSAANVLDVEVTNVHIRGTFSAVMFGLFAGADNLSGNVRVLDPNGNVLRAFDVSASYAFGGAAGGQDSIRINYLYEKFAELTRDQLRDQK